MPSSEDVAEIAALKKRKLQLQIEHLELINEKTRMELDNMKSGHIHYLLNNDGESSQVVVLQSDEPTN